MQCVYGLFLSVLSIFARISEGTYATLVLAGRPTTLPLAPRPTTLPLAARFAGEELELAAEDAAGLAAEEEAVGLETERRLVAEDSPAADAADAAAAPAPPFSWMATMDVLSGALSAPAAHSAALRAAFVSLVSGNNSAWKPAVLRGTVTLNVSTDSAPKVYTRFTSAELVATARLGSNAKPLIAELAENWWEGQTLGAFFSDSTSSNASISDPRIV